MAEAITLLEAWVKLNTKGPDSAQQRDVENSLESFRLGLTGLIATATATATAVVVATTKMAEGLFNVYYEAQRIGSTVERIKSFGQAIEQAGGSGQAAIADLEKFSEKFRVNPAFREAIKKLGHLSVEDMKDAQSAYIAYGKFLAKQRTTDPLVYGRSLAFSGMDEGTVLALGRSKFDEANQDAVEFDRGLDEIAKKSVRLTEDWLKVKQHINTILDLSAGIWMDIESDMLEKFDNFLAGHKTLFKNISDTMGYVFLDSSGKFDSSVFSKRVHNAFWDWLHSIDLTKLKNAFIAFANWLTTGWLSDKIKGIFGRIGSAFIPGMGAAQASGAPVEGDKSRRVDLGNGKTSILKPDGRRAVVDSNTLSTPDSAAPSDSSNYNLNPAMGRPNFKKGAPLDLVTWTTKGGIRVTSDREAAPHMQGFLEDLEAAGAPLKQSGIASYVNRRQASGAESMHSHGGAIDVMSTGRNLLTPAMQKWVDEHPNQLHAAELRNRMLAGRDFSKPDMGHWEWGGAPNPPVAVDKKKSPEHQSFLAGGHAILASLNDHPRLENPKQVLTTLATGSKTQNIQINVATTDPHTAASEIARHMRFIHSENEKNLRRPSGHGSSVDRVRGATPDRSGIERNDIMPPSGSGRDEIKSPRYEKYGRSNV